jgi:hypothetical protein
MLPNSDATLVVASGEVPPILPAATRLVSEVSFSQ